MSPVRPQATVLLVDDEAPIRTMVVQALKDYEVLVASDGPEALRMADAHPSDIHLLLADVMLPSGNGIAVAKSIVTKRPETAVLYMSGFQTETIRMVQNEGGPEGGFLEKPFTARVLVDRVRSIVESMEPDKRGNGRGGPQEADQPVGAQQNSDAVYRLETAVRCPQCGDSITTLKAVRLLRTQVNFTSTLPRRGRVAVCPSCLAIVPVELTNF
jgi:DNA-binding response OmpR family regulator